MPISKNRVYLDKDNNPTMDAAAGEVLLVAAGSPVSQELVDLHGLETVEGDEAKGLTLSGRVLKRAAAMKNQVVSLAPKPEETNQQADVQSATVSPKVAETQGDDSPAKGRILGAGARVGTDE